MLALMSSLLISSASGKDHITLKEQHQLSSDVAVVQPGYIYYTNWHWWFNDPSTGIQESFSGKLPSGVWRLEGSQDGGQNWAQVLSDYPWETTYFGGGEWNPLRLTTIPTEHRLAWVCKEPAFTPAEKKKLGSDVTVVNQNLIYFTTWHTNQGVVSSSCGSVPAGNWVVSFSIQEGYDFYEPLTDSQGHPIVLHGGDTWEAVQFDLPWDWHPMRLQWFPD